MPGSYLPGTLPSMDASDALSHIQQLAVTEQMRLTQHAQQAMAEEDISLDDVLSAIASGEILEDYPTHRRGPCCLLNGQDSAGRPIHVVCTTVVPTLIIITVYLPKPPKWPTPTQRSAAP